MVFSQWKVIKRDQRIRLLVIRPCPLVKIVMQMLPLVIKRYFQMKVVQMPLLGLTHFMIMLMVTSIQHLDIMLCQVVRDEIIQVLVMVLKSQIPIVTIKSE